MSDLLKNYSEKFKTSDMKELYEYWQKNGMFGPITFYGEDDEKWRVEIAFYETYEKLDNEDEYLRRLYITKSEDKYKVEVSEEHFENIIEVEILDFDELKAYIRKCYDDIKLDIKD